MIEVIVIYIFKREDLHMTCVFNDCKLLFLNQFKF